jgi:thiosulfate/3-mercaptopyruvate sulfurtransferase
MMSTPGRDPSSSAAIGVHPFVAATSVLDHLDDVVLLDVRWALDGSQGRAQHLEQTLPGAVYVDLDTDLSGPASAAGGRHPLPEPEAFATTLGGLGVAADDVVVAFDHGPGFVAARLVWMLRAIGQRAALLDGGLARWPGPTAPGGASRPAVQRAPVPWPGGLLADIDEVDRLRRAAGAIVVDVRDPARFRGELEPVDPRPGHIPGAINLPVTAAVREGVLLGRDELHDWFTAAGVGQADPVVVSCGSGVNACFELLLLEQLDLAAGRLFAGSWSAWSADPDRPAALGDA